MILTITVFIRTAKPKRYNTYLYPLDALYPEWKQSLQIPAMGLTPNVT